MEQNNPYEQNPYQQNPWQNQNIYGSQRELPNATLIMVMGICSIVICAIGPILATIGLVFASKATKLYKSAPADWSEASYKQVTTGKICSIIGLCIGIFAWVVVIGYMLWMYYVFHTLVNEMNEVNSQFPQ